MFKLSGGQDKLHESEEGTENGGMVETGQDEKE